MSNNLAIARFDGSCVPLGPADISAVRAWITAIDYADWPQQHRIDPAALRPAMVTDLRWHGFGIVTDPLVADIMGRFFLNCVADTRMLSVVMPGMRIEPHNDWQTPAWRGRVHVPLVTNPQALFLIEDEPQQMDVGTAYLINTEAKHEIVNHGEEGRIHFLFDVRLR